jgi:hypothetical protein
VIVISDIALGIGVLAVIQFYARMNKEAHFKAHSPTAKLLTFKGIIALMFLQQTIFSILRTHNVFKAHPKITVRDQHIGIQQCLVCLEMLLVVLSFHFSFRAGEYRQAKRNGASTMSVFRAAGNALNIMDLIWGAGHAVSLMRAGMGPIGDGSWKRSGGYQSVKDLNRDTSPYGGRSARGMRMKRFRERDGSVGRTPSPNPPPDYTYSDRRPLREPSPYRGMQVGVQNEAFVGDVPAAQYEQGGRLAPSADHSYDPYRA